MQSNLKQQGFCCNPLRTNDAQRSQRIRTSIKVDYAINAGATLTPLIKSEMYAASLEQSEDPKFVWYPDPKDPTKSIVFTGISFGRSEVKSKEVTDGISKTYLIGEKFMTVDLYQTATDHGDDQSYYSGFSNDNVRGSVRVACQDDNEPIYRHRNQFGGPHASAWNGVFCDGSVHSLSYDVPFQIHRRLTHRNDGAPLSSSDYE